MKLRAAAILLCALTACGGGGHSALPQTAATAPPTSGSPQQVPASAANAHLKLVVSFRRLQKMASSVGVLPSAHRRGARAVRAVRKPQYVSSFTQGLQIVATTGGQSITSFYNLASDSTLCTTSPDSGPFTTCTISAIPALAGSESIVATVTDATPTTDGSGAPNGFADTTNVLGVGSTTTAVVQGVNNTGIAITVDPVAGQIVDGYSPTSTATTFDAIDDTIDGGTSIFAPYSTGPGAAQAIRIVISDGVSMTGQLYPEIADRDGGTPYLAAGVPAATPFTDVNGAPTSPTVTATNAFEAVPVPSSGAAQTPVVTSVIPDLSYEWYQMNTAAALQFSYDGSSPANGLYENLVVATGNSAPSPWTGTIANPFANDNGLPAGPTYAASLTYEIVHVRASPTSVTTSPNKSFAITGYDYHALDGMFSSSADGNFVQAQCLDPGGDEIATITDGTIDTTSWQQTFTVETLAIGTCTFILTDNDSYNGGAAVSTTPITLNIYP